jgi:hypothetical protein
MYKIVPFNDQENYLQDFLALPRNLYDTKTITQNKDEERSLLLGQHVLSKYFKLHKYLVYKDDKVITRCALTMYPDDTNLYFGFFESYDDFEAVKLLSTEINRFAKTHGYQKIVGPVDASFWVKYRLKTNNFHKPPYVGEPYNKDYYLKLFLDNDFMVSEEYLSNYIPRLPLFSKKVTKEKQKYVDRYQNFSSRGYKIVSPNKDNFENALKEIYALIMELYNDFPIFKELSESDFLELYKHYKYVLDYSLVKVAYYNNEAVGFFIGTPDYGNILAKEISSLTYLRVFLKKLRSKNYVLLYMGVKKEHQGLGKAIVQTIVKSVVMRFSSAISALTKEERKTNTYFTESVSSVYKYVLLEKNVGDK